jgi:hypothetical protein
LASTRTFGRFVNAANDAGWRACDQDVGRNVASDNRLRGNYGAITDRYTLEYRGAEPNPHSVAKLNWRDLDRVPSFLTDLPIRDVVLPIMPINGMGVMVGNRHSPRDDRVVSNCDCCVTNEVTGTDVTPVADSYHAGTVERDSAVNDRVRSDANTTSTRADP